MPSFFTIPGPLLSIDKICSTRGKGFSERKTWENHYEGLHLSDHNATTPIDPMQPVSMMNVMEEEFGNPSSGYFLGARANKK